MENSNNITIYTEYDKISIIEYYLNYDRSLETIVSNLIDYYLEKQYNLAQECFHLLKNKINNDDIFYKIIKLSLSIVNKKPIEIDINVDSFKQSIKYSKNKIYKFY
jgi:hypothetical protein